MFCSKSTDFTHYKAKLKTKRYDTALQSSALASTYSTSSISRLQISPTLRNRHKNVEIFNTFPLWGRRVCHKRDEATPRLLLLPQHQLINILNLSTYNPFRLSFIMVHDHQYEQQHEDQGTDKVSLRGVRKESPQPPFSPSSLIQQAQKLMSASTSERKRPPTSPSSSPRVMIYPGFGIKIPFVSYSVLTTI